MRFPFTLGIDAAAIMLAINVPFFAQRNGALIAAALFEIVRQMLHTHAQRDVLANIINTRSVFVWADG